MIIHVFFSPEFFCTAAESNSGCRLALWEWSRAAVRCSSWGKGGNNVRSSRGSKAQLLWHPKTPWTLTGGLPDLGQSSEPQSQGISHILEKDGTFFNFCMITAKCFNMRTVKHMNQLLWYGSCAIRGYDSTLHLKQNLTQRMFSHLDY